MMFLRFVMKDLALNSVYASGWEILADLALIIDDIETSNECRQQFKLSSQAIQTKMFNINTNSFQSIYKDSNGIDKFSIANTIQNMFPILLSDLSEDKMNIIVSQLSDTKKFLAPYSLPTVAMDDPQFCPTFDVCLI